MLNKWVSIKDIYFIANEITIRVGSSPPLRDTYDISITIDTNKEKESLKFIKDLFDIQMVTFYGINGRYGYVSDYKFDVSCDLFTSHGSFIKSFELDQYGLIILDISSDYVTTLSLDVRRDKIIEEILNGRD